MKRFFSYDEQGNFELHDTLEQAKATAEEAFDIVKENATEFGWSESTEDICYGEVRGRIVETFCRPWDELQDGPAPENECERVEYALKLFL